MKDSNKVIPPEKLIEQLPEHYTLADRELVQRAYRIAEEAHRGQTRHSGEPYINHCIAVASILADLRVPPEVVAAGLLHDTVEDTSVTLEDIRRDFGDTVANLVNGVTKLTKLPRVSRGDQHAGSVGDGDGGNGSKPPDEPEHPKQRKQDLKSETLRKTFLAMGDDVRVVLIKLADRLHNMRTLYATPEEKQKRIAKETLDIFAPLANRLGIWQIKWELEDLGFRYVNPEKYKEIANQLNEKRPDREARSRSSRKNSENFSPSTTSAPRSAGDQSTSIPYTKRCKKGKPFDLVRDVRAVRLIVPDVPSCYAALGVIHTTLAPDPRRVRRLHCRAQG
jgi:GTP diphosphokinase / guanosine-3',5'-bis(diphosphate) 3'-diphosphatase